MARFRSVRRSSGFIRGGRPQRETQWLELPEVAFSLPGANSGVLLLSLTAAEKALRPFTVMRTRGVWFLSSDQSAASELYSTAMGACVVSDQASAVGITAVPTPDIDALSDLWFLYERITNAFLFGDGTGFIENAGILAPFDSRAMRKVEEGEDVVFVVENGAVTAAGALGRLSGRLLIKLH